MIRFKALLLAVLVTCEVAAAQPCDDDDSTCFNGHFCDTLTNTCRSCLSCKDLNREEPRLKSSCVKYIGECGPCLEDLVDSRSGDLTCVPRADGATPVADNSTTLWIVAGIVIVIFVVAIAAVVIRYMFRNTSIFKLHLDTNIGARLPTHVVATAPESPPPYSLSQIQDLPQPREVSDPERPLIKPYQPPFPEYEAQDHQNVSVFNPPAYVRLNNFTPRQPEAYSDVNENYSPAVHDEDTTPSTWAPGTNTVSSADLPVIGAPVSPLPQEGASSGSLSVALAVARNTDLIQPPQVTLRASSTNGNEEANNDNGADSHYNTQGASTRAQGNGNINFTNINQIIKIEQFVDKQRSF